MIRLRIDKVCQPGLEYKQDMRISAWRDTMKTALAVIRTRCNYSQTTLASVLGLSRQVVSAWGNGNKKIPEGRLAEIASLFGVPAALLTAEELDVVER